MFGKNELVGQRHFSDLAREEQVSITSIFGTLQGEGPYAGRRAVFVRLAKCQLACSFCFPSYKTIQTVNGTKTMDQLVEGDELFTLDRNLNLITTTVARTMRRKVSLEDMVKVTFKEEGRIQTLVCTKEHPFNVKLSKSKNRFTAAEDLKAGDVVFSVAPSQISSFRMSINNPMRDPLVADKVSTSAKEGYTSGRLTPYKRDKAWRKAQSERMTSDNPMWKPGACASMMLNKVYPKSGLETTAHELLSSLIDVKYVGNKKKFLIGDEESGYMRPDFKVKGAKKVIEVYDPTFPGYERRTPEQQAVYESSRRDHYAKFGYSVEFFKADEFDMRTKPGSGNKAGVDDKKADSFERKVNDFAFNGAVVESVRPLTKREFARVRFTCDPDNGVAEVVNVTCAPHNHFLMDGIHVHNCDTYFDSGDSMTVEQVSKAVFGEFTKFLTAKQTAEYVESAYYAVQNPWPFLTGTDPIIVFTGGEPGLQMPMLEKLIHHFVSEGLVCQIESNGIIPFTDYIWDNATVVISPKCAERNGVPTKYIKPHKTNLERAKHLKFVVTSDLTSPYSEIPEWALKQQDNRGWMLASKHRELAIYVSPMNIYNREPVKSSLLRESGVEADLTTRSTVDETISFWEPGLLNQEANQKNHEHAARLCMETGAQLSLQTHLYASLP